MFVDNFAVTIGIMVGVGLTLLVLFVIASFMRNTTQPKQVDIGVSVPNQSANSSTVQTAQDVATPTPTPPPPITNFHLSTRKLLTYQEAAFLKTLKKACGRRYVIAIKVRLNDVLYTREELGNELFRMYMNGHIDYLLVHPLSWEPVAGVELDDSTHQTPGARERDARKDVLFQQAQLPLKRFLLGDEVEKIRQWVVELGSDKFIEALEKSGKDEDQV
jgi:hypothetical protein